MGNSSSANDEEDLDPFDGADTLGYRVLGVQPDSPSAEAGLVSFLDFLVGANGKLLLASGEGLEDGDEYDDIDLPRLLQDHKDKELELRKYRYLPPQYSQYLNALHKPPFFRLTLFYCYYF